MAHEELHEIRKMTRRGYEQALEEETKLAARVASADKDGRARTIEAAQDLGYNEQELNALPARITVEESAGNPLAAIEIKPGETVMVIGCRTGADCFLAAKATGKNGKVVGVEEAPEEISIAREAIREAGHGNIEIRPGENENLPAADRTFDLVVTNCALTFSYDKPRVLTEAARILKKGAEIIICEPILAKDISREKRKAAIENLECLENVINVGEYKDALKRAGFKKIRVVDETDFPLSRMLRDKRVQARLAKEEISAGDIEALKGTTTSVKIRAIR